MSVTIKMRNEFIARSRLIKLCKLGSEYFLTICTHSLFDNKLCKYIGIHSDSSFSVYNLYTLIDRYLVSDFDRRVKCYSLYTLIPFLTNVSTLYYYSECDTVIKGTCIEDFTMSSDGILNVKFRATRQFVNDGLDELIGGLCINAKNVKEIKLEKVF